MFPISHALALALLTSAPVDKPAELQKESAEINTAAMRAVMQQIAIQFEILDKREVKYVLSRPEDFATDLNLLRKRYVELRDAPPLCDAMRFPDRSLVNELLTFNRNYRSHMDARSHIDLLNAEFIHDAISETDQLYQIWDLVRDCRCDYYYVTVRRQALMKLRDKVGYAAYYSGCLPPHVPVWRFQRVD